MPHRYPEEVRRQVIQLARSGTKVAQSGGGCRLSSSTAKRCKTRIKLANSIHDYIELFHNTRRRHSALGMLTPTEYEDLHNATQAA